MYEHKLLNEKPFNSITVLNILEDHLKEPEEPFWIKGNGYIIKGTTSVLLH